MLNRIGTDANETLFFPASDRFAVLTNHSTIEIWGIFTLSIENTLEIEYETKTFRSRFTISPNENIFFWHTGEPNFKYWIFNDNEPYLDIILNTTKRRTIQFSASGKYLSMEHSEGLQIWHTPKQNPLDLLGYSDGIWKIIFNPDETLILAKAGAHDRQGYHLWSTVTGEEIPIPPLFQGKSVV